MIRNWCLILLTAVMYINFSFAQSPKKPDSGEIYESIQKLNFLGSVLYIAAHPDDENTSLISYLSNDLHARTAYFSFTRGDGGQNLIGPEIRELLGVIRTQELLQARKIDGGIQFFSRAVDFGYSKNPEETLEFWSKKEVLNDLIMVINEFRPDVIINRFDHRTPGTTHGHHTASAMLSVEAFDILNNPSIPIQTVMPLNVWKPKRLMFNLSWFFYGSREEFEKVNKDKYFGLDIGSYYPTLGMSNNEISALSRSSHSSQGFGAMGERGKYMEFFETIRGTEPEKDIFDGINTTWNRVQGGKPIGEIIAKIEHDFDFKNPSASIPDLLQSRGLIQKLNDEFWREIKLKEIDDIIISCSGLFLEAVAPSSTAVAGENLILNLEAINRSDIEIKLNGISVQNNFMNKGLIFETPKVLNNNEVKNFKFDLEIPKEQKPTSPYWLEKQGTIGTYKVDNSALIGKADTPPPFEATFYLNIGKEDFEITRPVIYKFRDYALGEVYEPFSIVPKASVKISEDVLVFSDSKSKEVEVKVKSFTNDLTGNLILKATDGWKIEPESLPVTLNKKEESKIYKFKVTPPYFESETELIPELKVGDEVLSKNIYEINYDHIPAQKVLLSGAAKIVNIDIKKKGSRIGYVEGAGDSVSENLKQIGYEVDIIKPEEITSENLKNYDAIILGVRAFNVVPEMSFKNEILFEYVKSGGNLLVQYNTNTALVTDEFSPLPLKLSRNRVTNEDSEVRFLNTSHPALNVPNKITQKDFEGWVQERGLYFPNEWDKAFTPLLSMNDKGELSMDGSLLVAQYGKGYYVYTGLSFFRELPAGVPGAYRLLANLLSLGK